MTTPNYTVPGMKTDTAAAVIALLQQRLHALNDLALTLKHVHWNVVGPQFISVHTMLDPQVDGVRAMVDDIAERIASLPDPRILHRRLQQLQRPAVVLHRLFVRIHIASGVASLQ